MRVMAYTATLMLAIGAWGLWLLRRRKLATSRRFLWIATWAAGLPFAVNTPGRLLAESGRPPWGGAGRERWWGRGLLPPGSGVAPSVSTTPVAISVGILVGLSLTLGVVDLLLMLRYARRELSAEPAEPSGAGEDERVPAAQY